MRYDDQSIEDKKDKTLGLGLFEVPAPLDLEKTPRAPSSLSPLQNEELEMNCLRCRAPMYQVISPPSPPKATCFGCSQFVDCARCSDPKCGDTRCIPCYNKARSPGKATGASSGALVSDESEF